MRKFQISLNNSVLGKNNSWAAQSKLSKSWKKETVNLNRFCELIRERYNYTALFKSNHRKKSNFKQAEIISLDFDSGSLAEALNNEYFKKYAGAIYTTPSHSEDHNKFRVVFILPEVVTDPAQYEKIVKGFIHKFNSDPSCSDAARYYYGTGKNGKVYKIGGMLNNAELKRVLKDYEASLIVKKPKKRKSKINTDAPTTANRFLNYCIAIVYRSQDGEKHKELLKASRLLGGFIAGGLVNEEAGRLALCHAIRQKNIEDAVIADKTIVEGIEHGKQSPIFYEEKYIHFPCCLLNFKGGEEGMLQKIELYASGVEDAETIRYIQDFESKFGSDAHISVEREILEKALTGSIGKKSWLTFRVYAAIMRRFNKKFNESYYKVQQISYAELNRTAHGYKSKSIAPYYFRGFTDRQVLNATTILEDAEIIHTYLSKGRFKYYAPCAYIPDRKDFIEFCRAAIDNSKQSKINKKLIRFTQSEALEAQLSDNRQINFLTVEKLKTDIKKN